MFRSLALLFSLLTSLMVLSNTASAVAATAGGPYYSAVPASAPEPGKSVVRGLVWTCDGGACVAGEGESRPAIICATVAREMGALASFRAGEEVFDAAALAKCNAKAKGSAAQFARN